MKKKKDDNEDLFLSFLIKKKELNYIQQQHAQIEVKYMAKCFQDKEDNATIAKKIIWSIRDFFMFFVMKYIERKNNKKIKDLSANDKKEKILKHIQYKEIDFKTHYFLKRKFQNRTLVDDSCCVNISNFEYIVYLNIEYNGTITQKHYFKSFKNEQDAIEYFNQLLVDNKEKKLKNLLMN